MTLVVDTWYHELMEIPAHLLKVYSAIISMADSQKVVSAILGKIELMTPRTSPEVSPLCHKADLP